MEKTDLLNAARLIRDYCECHKCSKCPFKGINCELATPVYPMYWELEEL